ncbi:MAG: hypothetical protein ACRD8O_08805 [Bryobacteraceae bacterium]
MNPEIGRLNPGRFFEDQGALDGVADFTDVFGPRVREQQFRGLWRAAGDVAAEACLLERFGSAGSVTSGEELRRLEPLPTRERIAG